MNIFSVDNKRFIFIVERVIIEILFLSCLVIGILGLKTCPINGATFSAVQIGIHNAKVNTALARGVKNPGVKLNYWTGKQVQPGRSAWSFSNAKPNYVKATPVIEIGDVEFLGTPVDDVDFPTMDELIANDGVINRNAIPTKFSNSTIDDAVNRVMKNSNDIKHIFAPRHNLGSLVNKLGGQENTIRAVLNAANGRFPASGVFKNIPVYVCGKTIYIRGSVVNGIPRIGTMFIP